jgi:hypothetical protein
MGIDGLCGRITDGMLGHEIELLAKLETIEGRRIRVKGSILAEGHVRAEAQALFVELLSA